jgi:hypothetical protein
MNLENLSNLLQNRNMKTNIFIFIIGVSLLQFFDSKIIAACILFVSILVNYDNLIKLTDSKKDIKTDINNDQISNDMYYSSKVHDLLIKLKPYKKYNKITYKTGVRYMRKFFKTIHILEKDNLMNRNQYYEQAQLYLKEAINHFQSITISLPERSLINGIKEGDFEPTKKARQLSVIIKQLYNECYYILLNIGITFNQEWIQSPNIYTREIDLNVDRIESYEHNFDKHFTLY